MKDNITKIFPPNSSRHWPHRQEATQCIKIIAPSSYLGATEFDYIQRHSLLRNWVWVCVEVT